VVPDQLRARVPASNGWVDGLPRLADELAEEWSLRPDGPVRSGFHSAVWPVLDEADRPLVLKVTQPGVDTRPEAAALRHWAGSGACVRLHADDAERNALLLQRLDPGSSLETLPDVDRAVEVIATLLAALPDAPALDGFPSAADEAARIHDNLARLTRGSPLARPAARARETLASLRADPSARLLHFDAHFLNVLPVVGAADDDPRRWRLIDPLPHVGPASWEPLALLRNRWSDAVATGDPDRALRRRVDQVAEILALDPAHCRAVAQAVAVDNLLHLTSHDPTHMFVPPYSVMAAWGDH
jgi:streptomycin 6-kinase